MSNLTEPAELAPEQVEALKKKLLALRSAIASRHTSELRAQSSQSTEVEDEGDAAARANTEATLLSLAEADHTRLAEIERALAKIEAGTYGFDEETGEPIGYARLSVLPWARYAAATQEALDRGL